MRRNTKWKRRTDAERKARKDRPMSRNERQDWDSYVAACNAVIPTVAYLLWHDDEVALPISLAEALQGDQWDLLELP